VGTELELEVTTVAHGGVFVARADNRVVFVADAVPGERVLARVTDDRHDSYWRADTVRVLSASPDRQQHIWPEASVDRDPADRAGGAEFGHIRIDRQRELKRQVVEENLSRMAGLDLEVPVQEIGGSPDGTRWRTRVTLHVDEDGRVGPFAARSHRVIEVEGLPLASSRLEELAPLRPRSDGVETVDLVAPSTGEARMLPGGAATARETIVEEVGGRAFRLDLGGFWQVHENAAATLTRAVQDAVDDALLDPAAANLDLYGGVGLLAAALGERAGRTLRITSVESDRRATEYAQENLADWVGASAVTARVERYLERLVTSAGRGERARLSRATVVLDPPRSGAGKAVVRALGALRPAQLIYVACDPVALARDLGNLQRQGFRVTRVSAFDLFPNTHHVEAVATLVRDDDAPA